MKELLIACYINLCVLHKAPVTYIKYVQYCVIRNKTPCYKMLSKIMRIALIAEEFKKIKSPTTPVVYTHLRNLKYNFY